MSTGTDDPRSRNALVPAWNRPVMNGTAAASSPLPVVMGALWPSLSETANAPQTPPPIPSQESSLLWNQVRHSVRPSSSNNGATHRGRGRNNSTRNHTRAPVVNNPQTDNGVDNNPSQHRDSHRGSNNGAPRRQHQNMDTRASVVNSHLGYNSRPGLVQPPPFPGSQFRPALRVAPYLPSPLPFPSTQFMPPGFHPITGQPVFYGPPMMTPLSMRPHPPYTPIVPQNIVADLIKQIEYYFSEDNLVKDVYFRTKMDAQGWVSVTTIAEFNQVKDITIRAKQYLDAQDTDGSQFILNVMQNSQFVEVQEYNLRKRSNWEKYILRNVVESSSTVVETPGYADTTSLEGKPIHSNSALKVDDKAADDRAVE